jgi:hypothetical protein
MMSVSSSASFLSFSSAAAFVASADCDVLRQGLKWKLKAKFNWFF